MKAKGLLAIGVTGLVLLLPMSPAFAHEGEEEVPAKTLVQQAIALLRTQPDQVEAIEDKIRDALDAQDTAGVDLTLVQLADEAFARGELHDTWDLLELSVGAAPHTVVVNPNDGPRTPAPQAPGTEPSPVLHEEALSGSAQSTGGAPFLLGLAAVFVAAGLIIARRVH